MNTPIESKSVHYHLKELVSFISIEDIKENLNYILSEYQTLLLNVASEDGYVYDESLHAVQCLKYLLSFFKEKELTEFEQKEFPRHFS